MPEEGMGVDLTTTLPRRAMVTGGVEVTTLMSYSKGLSGNAVCRRVTLFCSVLQTFVTYEDEDLRCLGRHGLDFFQSSVKVVFCAVGPATLPSCRVLCWKTHAHTSIITREHIPLKHGFTGKARG